MATNILVRFIGDTNSLQRAFATATAATMGFESKATAMAAKLSAAGGATTLLARKVTMATLPFAILSAYAVKSAVDYEDSINKTTRLADASAGQARRWSKEILDVSRAVGKGPEELAEGLYFVVSSGMDASHAMDVLKIAAKGAAAGMGETKDVADLLTSVINAYGVKNITAAQAGDILTATVRRGKGEADGFAHTMGRLAPTASLLGVRFADLGAAMAVLTNNGMSSAEAATRINQAMTNILKPSAKAQETIGFLGGSFEEVRRVLKEKGLLEALQYLRGLTKGNDEAFARLLPNIRGLNAALILTNEKSAGETADIFRDLRSSTGDLDTAFDKAANTTKFKLNKAWAALQTVGVEIGTIMLPVVTAAAEKLADFFSRFKDLSDGWKTAIAASVASLVLVGPALFAIGAALRFMGSGLGVFTKHPYMVGIGLLVLGGIWLYNNWKPFQELIDKISDVLTGDGMQQGLDAFSKASDKATRGTRKQYDELGWFQRRMYDVGVGLSEFSENWTVFTDLMTERWDGFKAAMSDGAFGRGIDVIHEKISSFWTNFQRGATVVYDTLTSWGVIPLLGRIVDSLATMWESFIGLLMGTWKIFSGLFTQDWSRVWEGVRQVAWAVWDGIANVIAAVWTGVWNTIKMVGGLIWSTMSTIWGGIYNIVASVAWRIAGAAGGMWNGLISGIQTAYNVVVWLLQAMYNFFSGIVSNIWFAAQTMWNPVKDTIGGALRGVVDAWNRLDFSIGPWTVPSWIPGIGGSTFHIPDIIPDVRFAAGGIVSAPTIAMMGEGYRTEVVFPTNNPERGFSLLAAAGVHTPDTSGGDTTINYAPQFTLMNPRDAAIINEREYHWMSKTNGR